MDLEATLHRSKIHTPTTADHLPILEDHHRQVDVVLCHLAHHPEWASLAGQGQTEEVLDHDPMVLPVLVCLADPQVLDALVQDYLQVPVCLSKQEASDHHDPR